MSTSLSETMIGYVSLGRDCAFGMMQRYCWVEPLDLLRFSSSPLPGLLRQLDSGFDAFKTIAASDVRLDRSGAEYRVWVGSTGISLHTGQSVAQYSSDDVLRQESRRIPRLARKLLAELEAAERVVVYCREEILDADIVALHTALWRHGSVRLLAVAPAPAPDLVGCVLQHGDGTLLGYIDRVCMTEWARYPSFDVWLAIVRLSDRVFGGPVLPVGTIVRPEPEDFDIPAEVEAPLLWRALAALRRGETVLGARLFAEHRRAFPNPGDLGCEFDSVFTSAAPPGGI